MQSDQVYLIFIHSLEPVTMSVLHLDNFEPSKVSDTFDALLDLFDSLSGQSHVLDACQIIEVVSNPYVL